MGTKIYNMLVNRQDGIRVRYHAAHDGTSGIKKYISWAYLIWLNFAFYVLQFRFLGRRPEVDYYEQKRLNTKASESVSYAKDAQLSVKDFLKSLDGYDVVSFDIFDTLIFRSLALPTDVFYFIGEKLGIMDFKNIRAWAEWDARVKNSQKTGHMEIGLADIWENLEEDVGCDAALGMELEKEAELAFCYANPFMKEVWQELQKAGRRIIVVSDMYLPSDFLLEMLEKNGFTGMEKLYVSCEYGKSKADGKLFKLVKKELGKVSVVHVGDNPHSDGVMAKKTGFASVIYPNINHNILLYRPFDMSYLVGSAYRALVSAHLYNGSSSYGIEYEYGYLYGGLFVLGYCQFIHEYVQKHGTDRILFLSRDGDILRQVYSLLYPDEKTEYVYWSRKAATKLMADEDKHDYFRRFIYHKINQEYSIRKILHSMELDFLEGELDDWYEIWLEYTKKQEAQSKTLAYKQLDEDKTVKTPEKRAAISKKIEKDFSEESLKKIRKKNFIDLKPKDELTDKNGYLLRRFIEAKWGEVLAEYREQQIAAERYYSEVLEGCESAVAVDIGWAGSGALALSHLVEEVWKIPCTITGIIAGTNTIHNAEPDASEPFLQSGKLVAYLYSQSHNRDLLKKHDPNKDYNVFWELLLSSPQKQFAGFGIDDRGGIELRFGKTDANPEGIMDIQKGILDFVRQYQEHFKDYPYMFCISGRDAYAPMLVAASYGERYLKAMEKRFALKINVD